MILSSDKEIKEYTQKGWWKDTTIQDLFIRNVKANPDRVALVDAINRREFTDGDPQRLTYRELDEKVQRFCEMMLNEGIGKDDIIAVQMPNINELVCILLAAARLGVIISPTLIQYDAHELKYILSLLEPRAFFVGSRFKKESLARKVMDCCNATNCKVFVTGSDIPDGAFSLDELLSKTEEMKKLDTYLANTKISANDIFTICWTSGTEARPKGVPRSHNQWLASGQGVHDGAKIQPGETILNPRPLVNMGGLVGSFFCWLICGGKLVLHHPLYMDIFVHQLKEERVNMTFVPPAFLVPFLRDQELRQKADLSSVRAMGSGSTNLPPWIVRDMKKEYGIDIINFFGSNEGAALISNQTLIPNPNMRSKYFPRFGRKEFSWPSVPISSQIETKLVDLQTDKEITEPRVPGELYIRGATIFSGYFKADELTRSSFDSDGFFRSGDLFQIAGKGNYNRYYKFVGRCKDIIIRGGLNISPNELDELISNHPKIKEAAVFGYPDDRLGERVCVAVVPVKGQSITLKELTDFLREKKIAVYKLPEKMILMDALPKSPMQKVLRWKLSLNSGESTS